MGFLVTALLVLLAVAVALYLFRKLIGAAVTVGVLLLGLLIIIHLVLKAEKFVGRIPASAGVFWRLWTVLFRPWLESFPMR